MPVPNGTSKPPESSRGAPQALGTLVVPPWAALAALVPLTPGLPSLLLPRFGRPSLFWTPPSCRKDKDGLHAFLYRRGPTAHPRSTPPLLRSRRWLALRRCPHRRADPTGLRRGRRR